ncbi:hypothetical protein Z042_23140 [Chania multitudinisentens RB-25]|uniref:Uncharacterized protein n=1 Tax=Chania multitudinisentens RB-25 TaxID=1441930 RepID=W0LE95_9GAMM|nr:DUF2570 domain-containing protein [Chania multitudinisentens]AHG22183.1 hypothetical protein Z042_23140 [Chania multitudinisentens RB-25]
MTNKITLAITGVLAVVILALGAAAFYFHGESVDRARELRQAKIDVDIANANNAMQALQFQRANEISAAAGQYVVTIQAKSEERQNENRKALKNEECADRYIPDSTAQRLLQYADGLRAVAMRDSGQPDSAAAGARTTGRLTYRQAVLWIDPLLTVLDRANNDRAAIRQLPHQQPTQQEKP